ncbi:MAG: DEAD/DEAH box helicase [Myxococcales bacterium FL481]|nr:MAG: DEAD/DEAH box helicase [Myxococcales bacterium FL481]
MSRPTVSLSAADELLDAVRESCAAGVWSRGVELARAQAVVGERCGPDEIVLRVIQKRGQVSPAVSLYPTDLDWNCECKEPDDPCAHVAAAIIAVKQAIKHGQAPETIGHEVANERGRLKYSFEGRGGQLVLHRHVVVEGETRPLIGSLAERMADGRGPKFIATKIDHQFEAVVGPFGGGALAPKLVVKVLRALAEQPDLTYDGQPATIGSPTSAICLRVSSHGDNFVARLEQSPSVTEVFSNGAVREGRRLRAVAPHGMNDKIFAALRRGRSFAPADVGELVGELLPKLRANVTVIVDTDRLPGSVRLKPRLELVTEREGDQLSALPLLVYGDPAVARVDGERLTVFDATVVPIRNLKVEQLLLDRLDDLGLEPGVKRLLSAEDAIALAKVLDNIDPEISASGDSEHQAFFEAGELVPRLEIEDDGSYELWFETLGDEVGKSSEPTGKRADARAVMRAWERGDGMAPLVDGGFGRLPSGWLERFGDRVGDLLEAKRDAEAEPTAPRVSPFAAADLAELAEALDQPAPSALAGLRAIVDDFAGVPEATLPADLNAELRDYQRSGVAWLTFLRSVGMGGLLADDMGLGKTLQALCVVETPSLVVAPTSVLHNWAQEARRFRPGLSVHVYHGPDRELRADAGLTLTTYAILRLDIERLRQIQWRVAVLDEAQAIKNPDSKVAQAAFSLQAEFRVCMTGTPIENRLLDLWSQFRFVNRGLLSGRKRFVERYARPIAAGEAGSADRLRARIGPFVLRRRKSEVARELPPRTEVVLRCALDDDERRSYDAVRAATQQEVVARVQGGQNVLQILEALLRLRQAACHPALLPGHERFVDKASSKVALLVETLAEVAAEGHKSLVFSQWTSLLDLVEPHLRTAGLAFSRLDGSTRDRGAVVEGFQAPSGPPVMLLSLRAGGTGLNLTAADHVFLLDPWWNPAVEDQAADRAHRIGQDKPVIVHRLVAEKTVEEGILALQERKRELAEMTVGQAAGITREDLVALLS